MDNFQNKQRNEFDKFFKSQSDILTDNKALKIEFENLVNFIGLDEDTIDKRILDFGCGTGRIALRLANRFKQSQVVGIDMSSEGINKAKSFAKVNKIYNFSGKVDSKINETNYYDYIILVNLLHHTECPEDTLNKCHKALKDDGSLIIFENNSFNPLFPLFFIMTKQLKVHLTIQFLKSNRFSINRALSKSGFYISKYDRYAFLPTMLYNYSLSFKKINETLNKMPLIQELCAFHLYKAKKNSNLSQK